MTVWCVDFGKWKSWTNWFSSPSKSAGLGITWGSFSIRLLACTSFKYSKRAISVCLFSITWLSRRFLAETKTLLSSSNVLRDEVGAMLHLSTNRSLGLTSTVQDSNWSEYLAKRHNKNARDWGWICTFFVNTNWHSDNFSCKVAFCLVQVAFD